jgi:hypothetical protein
LARFLEHDHASRTRVQRAQGPSPTPPLPLTPRGPRVCWQTSGQTHITVDQLAQTLPEGFKTTAATEDMAARPSEVKEKFPAVESRRGKMADLLLEEQGRRIEN